MTPPLQFDDLIKRVRFHASQYGVVWIREAEELIAAIREVEASALRRAAEDEETVERVALAIQQAGDECYGNGMNVKDACDKLSRAALVVLIPSSPSAESDNGNP